MAVRIAEISLEGLPPQPPIHLQPKRVNLLYGRNENGKTRLVEFILASLLRSSAKMSMRKVDAAGFVRVNGVAEAEGLRFSPRGRFKLEDYLPAPQAGLPPQLARLLVVKGAENELQANAPGGLGRTALNEYLSNQGIIDLILERVPKSTQQSQILGGRVSGALTGSVKKRKETLERLAVIEDLFKEIDSQLSDGPLGQFAERHLQIDTAIAGQKTARQHYVNKLAADQADWKRQSDEMPSHEVLHIEADIREETRLKEEIDRLIRECSQKEKLAENYRWLEAALQTYQAQHAVNPEVPLWVFPLLAGLSVVATVILAFFNFPWAALVTALAALLTGFLSYRSLRLQSEASLAAPENKVIATEFERRFMSRCNGVTDLQVKKNALERDMSLLQTQSELLKKSRVDCRELGRSIDTRLALWLGDHNSVREGREAALNELQTRRARVDETLVRVEYALKHTPVAPVAGGEIGQADEYDPQKLTDLEDEAAAVRQQMDEINRQKTSLKQRICDFTGESVTVSLDELIPGLQTLRADLEHTARQLTAEIAAGIAVTQAAQELREGEDSSLQSALNDPQISLPVRALTGRYNHIDLAGDHLDVSDAYQTFRLDELSTGAQEQVLLGLRIGMASRLFSGQPLFLILDDAFQHSDWRRRPAMVDEILRLAKAGWQVFYLTMDDHLRDLFLEKTPPVMGDDFLSFSFEE